METEKRVGARSRVWRSRWFAGFVIGTLMLGAVALGGFALGGGGGGGGGAQCQTDLSLRLTIPGITDGIDKRGNWIEVESFHWGASQVAGAMGRIVVEPFRITKAIDKASPKLMEAFLAGKEIEEVTLEVYSGCGGGAATTDFKEYVVYAIRGALIASIEQGPLGMGTPEPLEEVSFNFSKITIDLGPQGGGAETLECGKGADWFNCAWK